MCSEQTNQANKKANTQKWGEVLTSQVYRRPDLVPMPLQASHLTLRDKDSFLPAPQGHQLATSV